MLSEPASIAAGLVSAIGGLITVFGVTANRSAATIGGAGVLAAGLAGWAWIIARRLRPDAQTRTWVEQERAERRVADTLDELTTLGWIALHDRLLPGGGARVPHILVGPPGVVLVTPVPSFGPVWLDQWGHLYAGPQPLDGWLRVRRWEQDQLAAAQIPHPTEEGQLWEVAVYAEGIVVAPRRTFDVRRQPAYPIPDAVMQVGLRHESRVHVLPLDLPGPLTRVQVAQLAVALEDLCPTAADPHA